jgi:ATP-dependent Clp protease protease subunit
MPRFSTAALIAALSLSPLTHAATESAGPAITEETQDAPEIAGRIGETKDDKPSPAERELKELRMQAELRQQRLAAELATLKEENERLRTQNELAQQRQQTELRELSSQKQKLEAELALRSTQQQAEHAPQRQELEALQRAQQLREAQLKQELAEMQIELEKLKQQQELAQARLSAELSQSRQQAARLDAEQSLLDAQHRAKLAEMKREQEAVALTNALQVEKLKSEQLALQLEQQKTEAVVRTADARIKNRELEECWQNAVNEPIQYRAEPFVDGVLYVSDRRIDLTGPIITGSADYLCDRIDYYNNQDPALPVFLVIDNCPGGSVMQGYRIVKAIESSKAPVHVVVKSFAASMAAIITTLADHSYAFPNAIILHHQMSAGASGNMTDLQEQIEVMKEWERRLAEPVAAKMGIDVATFKQKMYESSKSGDWEEFADQAFKLKWVNHIITELREEGIREKPTDTAPRPWWFTMLMKDESGRSFVQLPPLEPYDAYFMINPNGFYRVEGR